MTKKELNAITLADDLVKFLGDHPGNLASVHSVYPRAVNFLIQEDELITLTNHDDPTPMGLTVEPGVNFTEILKAGDQVIQVGDLFMAPNGTFKVNLSNAEVWETQSILDPILRLTEKLAQTRLELISWLGNQPSEGLLPLLPRLTHTAIVHKPTHDNIYSRYIADDLEAFTNAISLSDWEHALTLADRLIGFGMGSTPSCDDFLAAYLVVFAIVDSINPGRHTWIPEFNQSIANKAKNRTTLISANMLKSAAQGKISRSHQRLIQTCLFDNNGELELLADQVMRHGATSGGDFLLGLVCALEWVQYTMIENTKEGEQARGVLKRPQPVPGL